MQAATGMVIQSVSGRKNDKLIKYIKRCFYKKPGAG